MARASQSNEPSVMGSCNGPARLKLSNRRPVNSADPVDSFYAALSTQGLRVAIRMETPPSFAGPEWPVGLFEAIAPNWRGWVGEKTWGSLEDGHS